MTVRKKRTFCSGDGGFKYRPGLEMSQRCVYMDRQSPKTGGHKGIIYGHLVKNAIKRVFWQKNAFFHCFFIEFYSFLSFRGSQTYFSTTNRHENQEVAINEFPFSFMAIYVSHPPKTEKPKTGSLCARKLDISGSDPFFLLTPKTQKPGKPRPFAPGNMFSQYYGLCLTPAKNRNNENWLALRQEIQFHAKNKGSFRP